MPFYFNGKQYDLPGVYGIQKVIQQAGGTLPDFNIGLIIGKSMKGAPYNSSTKASEVMLPYDSPDLLAKDYGFDDIHEAFLEAKKQKAGTMFVLNAQPNTKTTAVLKGAGAVTVIDVETAPKNWGIFGNDIQLGITESASEEVLSSGTATTSQTPATTLTDSTKTWVAHAYIGKWVVITGGLGLGQSRAISENTTTVITVAAWTTNPDTTSTYSIVDPKFQVAIIPTKNEKVLTANFVSGQSHIYVNSVEGLSAGLSVDIMTQAGKIATAVILSVSTVYNSTNHGYKVFFTAAITNATITTANYARIMQPDTDNQYTITFSAADWNLDNIVHVLNEEQSELIFSVASAAVLVPSSVTTGYIGLIASAVLGTNPAVSTTDYTEIASLFPDWSFEFERVNLCNIRNILLITPTHAIHLVYRDLAPMMANIEIKKPIKVFAGVDLGETTVSSLIAYTAALNTDTFVLAACGLDGKAAYKSLACQAFGINIANPISHNMTRDLVVCSTVEKEWTLLEAKKLTQKGIFTVLASKSGHRIIQGITTYQDHTTSWNAQDEKTYLIRQRDLGDYYHITLLQNLDILIGADGVTKENVSLSANITSSKLQDEGYIDNYVIEDIKKVELGWEIKTIIVLTDQTDFIGLTTYIKSGVTA